ncbi:MAG: FecR domain-containing protein, partial [Chitinophagaceae bacterium]
LATQGNVNIIKTSKGGIAYQSTVDSRQSKIAYNTVYNSRGSNILSLTLNDGTRLWLNSESSVKFPVAFIGNERKVIVTGEVYFEVVKSSKKFLVDANGALTEVLGTHFNINAYRDKALVKITLLEGRVKVTSSNNQSAIIRPLQQVEVENSSTIRVIGGINPEEVMAWKNGSFQYKDADIEFIMKDLMRWYDIEVAYEGVKPAGHYAGVISRNTNLSEVLKMLELSGVKTKIKDRKIIVMQ